MTAGGPETKMKRYRGTQLGHEGRGLLTQEVGADNSYPWVCSKVLTSPAAVRLLVILLGRADRGPTSSGSNKFAIDSPLEEAGFELSVPRERG
jgi:hypothetical protein